MGSLPRSGSVLQQWGLIAGGHREGSGWWPWALVWGGGWGRKSPPLKDAHFETFSLSSRLWTRTTATSP